MRDGSETTRPWPHTYSDAELVAALREVREASEYASLSARIYADERLDRHPSRGTIERRLGSWGRAKRLLEGTESDENDGGDRRACEAGCGDSATFRLETVGGEQLFACGSCADTFSGDGVVATVLPGERLRVDTERDRDD